MMPSDAEVSTALDAVSVTRWLWTLKRDRGEVPDVVREAYATYERARTVLIELLRRESDDDGGPPHASSTRWHEPASLHGSAAADASGPRWHASTGVGDRLEATESQTEAENSGNHAIGSVDE